MKSRKHGSQIGHERWLVSYADFITLLFGFFVVMYAFSKAGEKKQKRVSTAIDVAFRSMGLPIPPAAAPSGDGGPASGMAMQNAALSSADVENDLERVQRQLSGTLAPELAAHTISMDMSRDGLVISLREVGFFASGSATPKPAALPALRRIAAALKPTQFDVRVEGHTDDIPIHNSKFDSNWELSAVRATNIAQLLLELNAVPPQRLSAAGYAEYHPVASNATPEGRAQNRRVDLVILPRSTIDFSATKSASARGAWRKIDGGE